MTTRGARSIPPSRIYVAGLFDMAGIGHAVPGLVPAADWLQVRILLAGTPIAHHPGDLSSHRMTLDMRRGALLSHGHHSNSPDMHRVRSLRLVSLSERAVGLQLIQFEIEAGTAEVTFEASFEGMGLGLVSERTRTGSRGVAYPHSGKRLAMATASSLQIDGDDLPPTTLGKLNRVLDVASPPRAGRLFPALRRYRTERWRRSRIPAPKPGKSSALRNAPAGAAWSRRMRQPGRAGGRAAMWRSRATSHAQRALRFALYHLNSAANPADERVSIGARALTGDDYHGHVFWDTEIFLLPFYILTWPEAARALLMYRFHTLGWRAGKSRRDGLARRALRLGVRRYRRGNDAGAGDRSGSSGRRRPVRQAGAAHQRRRRLCGLAILAGDRRRRLPARRRRRDLA